MLDDESLVDHYRALLDHPDSLTRQMAAEQLARLEPAQPPSPPDDTPRHNRWLHVPLEKLFEEVGNTLQPTSNGYRCGHEPVHASESGTCVAISPDGRWYCHSCKKGGDAVSAIISLRGVTPKDAIGYLTTAYGPPELPREDSTAQAASLSEGGKIHLTDYGNAQRLAARHGQNLRFCHLWGKWLIWDGQRWAIDETAEIVRRAKETIVALYAEAAKITDTAERAALIKHALKSEAEARLMAMVTLAESEPGIPVTPAQLDADPWLLNVQNGTLDLRTGTLQLHRREDLLTKRIPLRYDEQATCPVWGAFLYKILAGNAALIRFSQKAVGYSLTGDVSEQGLFFLHGRGANGKSTLLRILLALLSTYGKQAEPELLLAKRGETHPTGVADLLGSRLVVSIEVEEGRRMAEVLVKQLTGGDRMKARFMRQDFFEFDPTWKLWLAANHKPRIRGTDHAIWRRIRLIPFTVTIPDQEQDKKLLEKLLAELPGILVWAVQGCLAWQREGLGEPEEVLEATAAYRREMDVIGQFIDQCCVQQPHIWGKLDALYIRYKQWCEEAKEYAVTRHAFTDALRERGFEGQKRTHGYYYVHGLGLVIDPPEGAGGVGGAGGPFPGSTCENSGGVRLTGNPSPPSTCSTRPGPAEPLGDGEARPQSAACLAAPEPPPTAMQGATVVVAPALPTPDFEYVTEPSRLRDLLSAVLATPRVALDTETYGPGKDGGLDPRRGHIRLVQLATPERILVIDAQACDPKLLLPLFDGGRVILGHNLGFDLQFLAQAGLPLPAGAQLFDTQLAAQLLGAGTPDGLVRQCRLDTVVTRYLGITLDKSWQKSDWSATLSADQLAYAAADAQVVLRLGEKLRAELAAADLAGVAAIEMRACPAISWLELNGVPLDREQWCKRADGEVRQKLELEQRLNTIAGAIQGQSVNWQSPMQVLALLRARGHCLTRTDEATLRPLAAQDELIDVFLQYREAAKRAGTYGVEWIPRYVHPLTGRIHAHFLQCGAETGRMACSRPNLQNIPRGPAYRACIRPPEGYVILKADYSQIEARLVAVIAREEAMLRAFHHREDLHVRTAAAVLGVPAAAVTKEHRQLAKALNYGLIFGMGAPRLKAESARKYHVHMTDAEAVQHRARFFATYRGLHRWHREVGGRLRQAGEVEVRTLTGRRQLAVTAFTNAVNTPVQGSAGDGFKLALARLFEHREEVPTARLISVIHDEILIECPAEAATAAAEWLRRHMVAGMSEVVSGQVPIEVDVTPGRDWAGTPIEEEQESPAETGREWKEKK